MSGCGYSYIYLVIQSHNSTKCCTVIFIYRLCVQNITLFSCSYHSHRWCYVMRELVETMNRRQTVAFLQSLRLFVDSHSSPAPPAPPHSTLWPVVMTELLNATDYRRVECDMHASPSLPLLALTSEDWTSDLVNAPRPSLSKRRSRRPPRFELNSQKK